MKCEQIAGLLPDYLLGDLAPEQHQILDEHLAQCAECRDDVAIWNKLAALPAEQPSLASRERFDAMLQAYRSGREARMGASSPGQGRASFWDAFRWLRSPVGAAAWGMALVVLGVFIGTRVSIGGSDSHAQELSAMHDELASMRQMVALSMLQQQSASGRLEGVTWTRREEQLNPQVLSALVHTLRYDPSVDVRLAALDALSRHAAAQPQLRSSVADALQEQQSPLVQVALIDQLVEWRDRQAEAHLQQLRHDPKVNPTVRQRADWAISKLN
jgi:predicted anti-sigma-YlaC factor YlaD